MVSGIVTQMPERAFEAGLAVARVEALDQCRRSGPSKDEAPVEMTNSVAEGPVVLVSPLLAIVVG